jgi:hypothetical protein
VAATPAAIGPITHAITTTDDDGASFRPLAAPDMSL